MAQGFHDVGKGFGIRAAGGGDLLVRILSGVAAPDGLGDQFDAPVGSIYLRSGTGELYQKIANNGNAADYELNGAAAASIGKWREEKIKAVTNDTVSIGSRDLVASPFADDNGTLMVAADFSVGDYIIADADGTPALLEVTAISGDSITVAAAANPLVAEDTFIAINYLPDPNGGENRAIVNYNGSVIVKLADIDWSLATGINLSGTYSASSGNVAAGDTVEVSIQKLDGVNDAQDTLLGTAQGATNLGSWTSPVDLLFSATSTVKALFQRIGDLLMQLRGVQVTTITTATTVDQVPVASVKCVKWLVEGFVEANTNNRRSFEIYVLTNGTAIDYSDDNILEVGSSFNLTYTVDISGGNLRLRLSTTGTAVTVTARRIEVVKSLL